MQPRAALQGTIQHYTPHGVVYGRRCRAKACSPAEKVDTRSFLSQKIDSMLLCDSPMMKTNTEELFEELKEGCKRLFSLSGDSFPITRSNSTEGFVETLEKMEIWAEKHGLSFTVSGEGWDDNIDFVLYCSATELEMNVFHFYLSPIDSLSKKTGSLYNRFIHYVSESLGINIMPESTDNRYFEMMMNFDGFYDEEDEEDQPEPYILYSNDEHVKDLFLQCENANVGNLYNDLLKHRKKCSAKELNLVELMIEGMEILPFMNISQYDFNPYIYDKDSDGYIELPSTLAILYSANDGMEDAILEAMNNDSYCGLVPQGWNKWFILSKDATKEDYEALTANSDMPKKFHEWNGRFYEEMVNFDDYIKEETLKE